MTAKKPKKEITLEKYGMRHDCEWMLVAPSRYDDYVTITRNFKDLTIGNIVVVEGTLIKKKFTNDKNMVCDYRSATRLGIEIRNVDGQVVAGSAFGRPGFAWQDYPLNEDVMVRGKVKQGWNGGLEISMVEPVPEHLKGRIVPIYPNVKVTKGERFREKIEEHFHYAKITAALISETTGWNLPDEPISMAEISEFSTPLDLVYALHKPKSVDEGEKARRAARLISGLALIRNTLLRAELQEEDPDSIVPVDLNVVQGLKGRFKFALTNDQSQAVDGIVKSLIAPLPMSGLISGDVGTGKTATFLIPMVATFLAGKCATLLTPNLLLIDQVAAEIKATFPEIPVCTLNGKQGMIGDPNNSILIGNTALIGAYKKNKIKQRPHFLVVDEQHKFSVEQRQAIAADYTNVIEATATPIPRTAALVTHGTADVYLLRETPVEKTIDTKIMTRNQAKEARNEIVKAIYDRNEQAAVVYPLVATDNPEKSKSTVTEALESWRKHVHESLIAVLHGKMSDEEKAAVLASFRSGEKRLLVASTVIEVGLTLPELKTMMVINADRFGVVTLHQLRGRLARHGGIGLMILFSNDPTDTATERLGLLVENSDGFILAEKDAELRGYGDIIGNDGDSQSGKTRTLFLGVNVGPSEISFAANLYATVDKIEKGEPLSSLTSTTIQTLKSSNSEQKLTIKDSPPKSVSQPTIPINSKMPQPSPPNVTSVKPEAKRGFGFRNTPR
jgi:ATP-dependent DNA helicase RecG